MNRSRSDASVSDDLFQNHDEIPETLPDGSAICIAKPAPLVDYAIPLRVVNRYADRTECRIIVTSSVSADETIQQQQATDPSTDARLGIVNTTADEHLASLYQENPTISLPCPGELSQLALAVWDLHEALSSSCPKTHVIFRSLSPMLNEEPLERVTSVVEQVIDRQRADSSLTVCSIEYTKHDEATMAALKELVDGIIWVEQTEKRDLRFDYQRTRTRTR